jgi:hypothetical protein
VKKHSRIVKQTLPRLLKVTLTDEEHRHKGELLARAIKQLRTSENETKAIAAFWRDVVASDRLKVEELSNQVADRFEMRDVECEEVIDYEAGKVFWFRTDTGDKLSERDIEDSDRQTDLLPEEA